LTGWVNGATARRQPGSLLKPFIFAAAYESGILTPDAVVYDAPILRYLVNERHASSLRVLPTVLARQEYGIGLPPGSPLREEINRQILEITRTPEWTRMLGAYLGPEG
jgi:hypothetical protein